ncbi:MAG TPA: GGDEF domain-containing protein [Terriglobales bacterium]|nr:GGDEF domain-containing protein [Terriglobales bacterium]
MSGITALSIFPAVAPPSSYRLVCFTVLVAAALLCIRLHCLKAFLLALSVCAQWAVYAFTPTQSFTPAIATTLVALNFALILLVEDKFFDWQAVSWWVGLLGIQWTTFLVVSRWSSVFLTDVAWNSFDFGVAKVGLIEGGMFLVGSLLVLKYSISPDAAGAGQIWALLALFFGMKNPAAGEGYMALAGLALGISAVERSHWIAYHDELTGLPGRRAFNEAIAGLMEPYSIAIVDVDHFKKFNDTFGHDTGDQVLRKVATQLSRVRGGGRAYRCGGEEFAIIFSGLTSDNSLPHSEEVRARIEADVFVARGPSRSTRPREDRRTAPSRRRQAEPVITRVTVSIGLADSAHRKSTESVIQAADQALYKAKDLGRNRVERAVDLSPQRSRKAVGVTQRSLSGTSRS